MNDSIATVSGGSTTASPARLVILHEGQTPTLAYFGAALAAQFPNTPLVLTDLSQNPENHPLRPQDFVVILRYLNRPWQKALTRHYTKLAGLAYFMDDDLLDTATWHALPRPYVRRLKDKVGRFHHWLNVHCTAYWVPTPALAHKYENLNPRLMAPRPTPALVQANPPPAGDALTIAYHGSLSHWEELQWLVPIMKQVLQQAPTAGFQVFGPEAVRKLYGELPRTTVIHPLNWPSYLHFTQANTAHIALAPLRPLPFNAGRGAAKFYDYTRMGAAGIYANRAPYAGFIHHETDGLLLNDNPAQWVEAIGYLINHPEQRQRLAMAAQARARKDVLTVEIMPNKIVIDF